MSIPHSAVLRTCSAQMLGCLASILRKGAEHAATLKVAESVLLDARLYPDMFPLSRQVQIACDQLTRGAARLSGSELPSFADTETSFAQLIERTQKANAYVQGTSAEMIDARAESSVTFPIGGGAEMTVPARDFLLSHIIPNLYFHAATAYDILRHNGVTLGKRDFLRPG